MRERLPHLLLAVSVLVFAVASVAMSRQIEPFHTWFYLFAWWPYIFAVESLLAIKGGESLLWQRPRAFWTMLPLSVVIWCVFEALNFRLQNWHYLNLPPELWLRWPNYFLSYATVLPAIFATERLLRALGVCSELHLNRTPRPDRLAPRLLAAGVACLLLPLLWPKIFFPLVWLAALFLLEPLLHKAGRESLLRELAMGEGGQVVRLLLAGLLCGLLWECWNFWAGAKWYYTLPWLAQPKIFEMPLAGYLGFAPFALACLAMYRGGEALWDKAGALRPLLLVLGVLFCLAVFAGIDRFTVTTFG